MHTETFSKKKLKRKVFIIFQENRSVWLIYIIFKGKREEGQENFKEFKASLGYIVTSMPVKITVQSPVSKNRTN